MPPPPPAANPAAAVAPAAPAASVVADPSLSRVLMTGIGMSVPAPSRSAVRAL
jgi:hypothetical protein